MKTVNITMKRRSQTWCSLIAASLVVAVAAAGAQAPKPKPKPAKPAADTPAASAAPGTLLLIADAGCIATVDGKEIGSLQPGQARQARVALGQHFVRAVAGDVAWEQIVEIKNTAQVVLKIPLAAAIADAEAKKTPQQKAQGVARRALDAMGGLEAIKNVRTLTYQSSFARVPSDDPLREDRFYFRFPDAARWEAREHGQLSSVTVTLNDTTWQRTEDKLSTHSRQSILNPDSEPGLYKLILRIITGETTIGKVTSTGQEIVMTESGGSNIVFDASTALPTRFEDGPFIGGPAVGPNATTYMTTTYTDWRRVQGFLWPFKETVVSPMFGLTDTTIYTRVEFNRDLDSALFRKP